MYIFVDVCILRTCEENARLRKSGKRARFNSVVPLLLLDGN